MNPPLPKRRIGRSAVEVTVLGLGGAPLGNLFEAIPEDRAFATIAAGYAAGVRLFDTAPQYGHGMSEHRFGRVLRDQPRDSFVLSTKVGRMLRPQPPETIPAGPFKHTLSFGVVHDYSYDAAMRSVEDSLQRLGLHRIDIALVHDVDRRHQGDDYAAVYRTAIGGACRALSELRAAGVIGAYGIGVNEVEPCVAFARDADLDCIMLAGRYTLLEQNGLDDLFPLLRRTGASLLVAGPFNSGILATGARPGAMHDYAAAQPEVIARVRALDAVCARHGTPLGAAAIQFPLAHPSVAAVVAGAVRPEEAVENVALMTRAVPAALWEELRGLGLVDETAPLPTGVAP